MSDRPNRHRIRTEDLEQSIFSPKTGNQKVVSHLHVEPNTVVFTIKGKQDEIVNDLPILHDMDYTRRDGLELTMPAEHREEACAKHTTFHNEQGALVKYYIKRGPTGRMFNPIGVYDEIRHAKSRVVPDEWKYREVGKKAFNFYLDFLTTKNYAHLVNAERELS
tara:strand:- start:172 stop:663 length:492 start_codon:yes stop_codon:yes gene_type:complete